MKRLGVHVHILLDNLRLDDLHQRSRSKFTIFDISKQLVSAVINQSNVWLDIVQGICLLAESVCMTFNQGQRSRFMIIKFKCRSHGIIKYRFQEGNPLSHFCVLSIMATVVLPWQLLEFDVRVWASLSAILPENLKKIGQQIPKLQPLINCHW